MNCKFSEVEENNPLLFTHLVSGMDEEKGAELRKLMLVCTQQEALDQSKHIAQSGGYAFNAHTVPNQFKFS